MITSEYKTQYTCSRRPYINLQIIMTIMIMIVVAIIINITEKMALKTQTKPESQ